MGVLKKRLLVHERAAKEGVTSRCSMLRMRAMSTMATSPPGRSDATMEITAKLFEPKSDFRIRNSQGSSCVTRWDALGVLVVVC